MFHFRVEVFKLNFPSFFFFFLFNLFCCYWKNYITFSLTKRTVSFVLIHFKEAFCMNLMIAGFNLQILYFTKCNPMQMIFMFEIANKAERIFFETFLVANQAYVILVPFLHFYLFFRILFEDFILLFFYQF